MGKRSEFTRRKNDDYRTWDPRAVAALLPHLKPQTRFVEPCAGGGILLDQLERAGHVCVEAYDIEPWGHGDSPWFRGIQFADARTHRPVADPDEYITNPPWTREILHDLIVFLSDHRSTWMLFDTDWMFTKQARQFGSRLRDIVAVGRLRWIPGTTMDGKDNCAWYRFSAPSDEPTHFHGRL